MRITKFLAGAALVGAPLSVISAQSEPRPDTGATHHNGKWIAGASGAAVGAALFLTFTGNDGTGRHASAFTPPPGPPAPPAQAANTGVTTAGVTAPPSASPPAATTPPHDVSTPPTDAPTTDPPPPAGTPASPPQPGDATQPASPPTDSGSATPSYTGSVDTPAPAGEQPSVGDGDPAALPNDSAFIPPSGDQPQEDVPPGLDGTSTVPEPGSLALTATGLFGLLPLVRRRRR